MHTKTIKEGFRKALKEGTLSLRAINDLLLFMGQYLKLKDIPKELLQKNKYQEKITDSLLRLKLGIAEGNKSWKGLVVGFPGTKEQLSTEFVGTPYIREILYPILELHKRLDKKEYPCIYLLGERFNDVFLRKFRLLNSVTPHVIILTGNLLRSFIKNSGKLPSPQTEIKEAWIQSFLCEKMLNREGLEIPVKKGIIRANLISHEVPAYEGTKDPERLDILGYDKQDKSLIAFEIKGPGCGTVQLENLFLQGMEHRNWLEENKMAIKLLFEGPKGDKINTRKRVRLILGFCSNKTPKIFKELREVAVQKDKHLKIDFCRFVCPKNVNGELKLFRF